MEQTPKHDMVPSLKGAYVLLVEDDFLVSVDVEAALAAAGAQVIKSRTLRDGLALADQEPFAAAILDIRLGRENVAPVARRLGERGIPFFFYSGQVDIDAIRTEWPHRKIITKPARPRTLVNAIVAVMKEKNAAAAGDSRPRVPY
jgi:DNA-binding response OmpR family regulator